MAKSWHVSAEFKKRLARVPASVVKATNEAIEKNADEWVKTSRSMAPTDPVDGVYLRPSIRHYESPTGGQIVRAGGEATTRPGKTGQPYDYAIALVCAALQVMSIIGSTDEAIASFKEKIEAQRNRPGEKTKLDGLIAGYSENHGPVVFYFHTYPDVEVMAGMEPFTFYEVDTEFLAGPHPSPRQLYDSGLPMFWPLDGLAEYGATFFNVVRQNPMVHLAHPDQPELYGIGGHVDHAVIGNEGVAVARIHEWPDKVGEKIQPLAA